MKLGRVHAAAVPHLHTPSTHASARSGLQTTVQPPQWVMSPEVSMQAPSQHDWPVGHGPPVVPQTQSPSVQVSPAPQTLSHAPQLFLSESTVRQPPGQQSWPGRQLSEDPLQVQCDVPLAVVTQPVAIGGVSVMGQRLPQKPQLSGSVVTSTQVSTQHRSGSAQGGVQAETMHVPLSQIWPLGQTWPQ